MSDEREKILRKVSRGTVSVDKRAYDIMSLQLRTTIAGGCIALMATALSLAGLLIESKIVLLVGFAGEMFALGVLFAIDIGRRIRL